MLDLKGEEANFRPMLHEQLQRVFVRTERKKKKMMMMKKMKKRMMKRIKLKKKKKMNNSDTHQRVEREVCEEVSMFDCEHSLYSSSLQLFVSA